MCVYLLRISINLIRDTEAGIRVFVVVITFASALVFDFLAFVAMFGLLLSWSILGMDAFPFTDEFFLVAPVNVLHDLFVAFDFADGVALLFARSMTFVLLLLAPLIVLSLALLAIALALIVSVIVITVVSGHVVCLYLWPKNFFEKNFKIYDTRSEH